jgi:hypothetical protein
MLRLWIVAQVWRFARNLARVIIMTLHCLEESDGVVCLELGANDFIIETFRSERTTRARPGDLAAAGNGPRREIPRSGTT